MKAPRASNPLRRLGAVPVALALAAGGCSDDGGLTTESGSSGTGGTGSSTDVDPTGGPTSSDGTSSDGTSTGGPTTSDGTSTGGPTSDATTSDATTSDATSDATTNDATTSTDSSSTAVTATEGASSTGDDSTSTGEDTDTGVLPEEFVQVQVLAFNDFHGALEPPSGSAGQITKPDNSKVAAGGAAFLATHIAALRAENPNTVVVSAGDLIGASPLISALFHDEPTIEAMNQIGLDYNAVGNHEFDEGATELLRMQSGGCHPEDGCADGTPFPGASFEFLAANVLTELDPVETLFPSYAIHETGGVKVAFIGMTLQATASIVMPTGVAGLTFVDEAERANALVPELVAMGVEAIVVLVHEGGYQGGFYDDCAGISGPIVDIVNDLSDEIDLVVTGHTHQAYNCVIDGKVVTSAANNGRVITDIDLEISTKTGDVTAVKATNVIVTRDAADPVIEAFVALYKDLSAPLANQQIGTITGTLLKNPPMVGMLSTMGGVLADAHLAATADPMFGGAQIAFMNPGGVRADLLFPKANGEAVDGIVTYGEAFTVQPFGNNLVVLTLTGAQIDALLEQQFAVNAQPNVLHVSQGFAYAYSASAPVGSKIDPASITLDGVPLEPDAAYRVATISYLAAGGDSFSVFTQGTDVVGGVTDMDALVEYFAEASPVSPPALDRITVLP